MKELPQVIDPNRRYRITPDAIFLLGISRATLYERIEAGQIQTIRDGRRVFIHGSELIRYSSPNGAR
jgi:excisionase family DNA binding protein